MSLGSSGSVLDRVPIAQGIVAGLVAWVANLVVIVGLVAGAESTDDPIGFGGNVFYNAQLAMSKAKSSGGLSGSQTETGSVIAGSMTDLAEFVYYAAPIVVLLLVGIALARVVSIRDPGVASLAGATMAIGYLLLTVIGTQVFSVSVDNAGAFGLGSATISPMLNATTIVVMGILYPAIFGSMGASIGSRL